MNNDRRAFLKTTAALASATTLGAWPRHLLADDAPKTHFTWTEIADGLHVASGGEPGGGGNTLLAIGEGKSTIIDTKVCGIGHTLRREVNDRLNGTTLTQLINTHHHGDHIGGNNAFNDLDILAQENLEARIEPQLERLRNSASRIYTTAATNNKLKYIADDLEDFMDGIADLNADLFKPNETVTDEDELEVGGIRFQLRHAGAGHTDNDLIVFLPDANVLHTGDLLFNGMHPYMDVGAGANSRGWQQSLLNCLQMCDGETTVIPGHGEITNADGIRRQITYFDDMRKVIRYARDVEGMTREQVIELQPGKFKDLGFEQLQPIALGAVFDELAKEGR